MTEPWLGEPWLGEEERWGREDAKRIKAAGRELMVWQRTRRVQGTAFGGQSWLVPASDLDLDQDLFQEDTEGCNEARKVVDLETRGVERRWIGGRPTESGCGTRREDGKREQGAGVERKVLHASFLLLGKRRSEEATSRSAM